MFGRNAFLYDRPMLGHGRFEALPMDYQMGQDATPVVVTTPAVVPAAVPAVVVATPSPMATLGTLAVVGLVGFLATELTGITHVLGLRKYMR